MSGDESEHAFDCDDNLLMTLDEYGIYTFTIYAEDTFGLVTSVKSETVTIADSDPPTIMVSSPRGTSDLLDSKVLLKTVTNEEATCSYIVNGGTAFSMNQSEDGLTQQAVISPSTSPFTIQFICEDIYGNKAESVESTFDWFYYDSTGGINISLKSIVVTPPSLLSSGVNVIEIETYNQKGDSVSVQDLSLEIIGQDNYTISEIRSVAGQVGVYEIEFILPEYSKDKLEVKIIATDGEEEISEIVEVPYTSNKVVKGFGGFLDNLKDFFSDGRWIILVVVVLIVAVGGFFLLNKGKEVDKNTDGRREL